MATERSLQNKSNLGPRLATTGIYSEFTNHIKMSRCNVEGDSILPVVADD